MNNKVDFGFEKVNKSLKTGLVQDLFKRVSSHYDLMNDLMSGGLHRLWKNDFVHSLELNPDDVHLDVAGGTGDITIKTHQAFPFLNITSYIYDLTHSMLEEGRNKAIDQGLIQNIKWLCGTAENLPFPDESFDVYTISFGLRNVTDRTLVLKEALRVLKPGGRFYCLEFSQLNHSLLQKAYDIYSFNVIPFLGKHIAHDEKAYQYLVESIRRFPNAIDLENELIDIGFSTCNHDVYLNGVVAKHYGIK